MIVSVDEIRSKYPHPESILSVLVFDHKAHYCVGGALCLYLGISTPAGAYMNLDFPTWHRVVDVLTDVNSNLTIEKAEEIAAKVTRCNDREEFEDAWAWLAKGLEA